MPTMISDSEVRAGQKGPEETVKGELHEVKRSIVIDRTRIHLREPDKVDSVWIGQPEIFRLLGAAWLKIHARDQIMTPILVGPPGSGKTTLACAVARDFARPVYLINCTSDMRPEDLLITPVLSEDQKIMYRASSLVSAVVNGGICILDEANRMNEKTWASLASLLDDRRYVESVIAGVKIPAHPEFRLVATMNDDASTFNLPEYIESRLRPVLPVGFPGVAELKEIIAHRAPMVPAGLIAAVVDYLEKQREQGFSTGYSVRDAIQITRYAEKVGLDGEMQIEDIARRILKIRGPKANFTIKWA